MVRRPPQTGTDALTRGRDAYESRQWQAAYDALNAADGEAQLVGDDLDRLLWSAALTGRGDDFLAKLERRYQAAADAADYAVAARAAFWSGFRLMLLGEMGRATGWLGRARRMADLAGDGCAVQGYLMVPAVFRSFGGGDNATAYETATEAADIGERCGDADLVAIARHLQGRALIRQGSFSSGLTILDEIMLPVTDGQLSPLVTGIVFCGVIATCQQAYALDRAREWTTALTQWCEQQPQLVTFTGSCMVHRSEIMQLGGNWTDAIHEANRVCERVASDDDNEVLAAAHYQRGELHRLRGALDAAEEAYRLASHHGREPQPGLALLRVAQGQTDDAVSAMQRMLQTTIAPWQRARFLPACIEIMLAAGELDTARAACDELEKFAREVESDVLAAMSAHMRGALHLAKGDARGAVEPLRIAFGAWQSVGAPHVAARIRVLLSRAYRALGDKDGADLELTAAQQVFEQLGAAPELEIEPAHPVAPLDTHGLSPREREVLRLVARGETNKAIARALHVSERTVDRHVSNIFMKLNVSTRAAATAFAYENNLL